jgi:hypothetical protein
MRGKGPQPLDEEQLEVQRQLFKAWYDNNQRERNTKVDEKDLIPQEEDIGIIQSWWKRLKLFITCIVNRQ